MNHTISLTFHDSDVSIQNIEDKLVRELDCEINNSTINTISFYADIDTETLMESLNSLFEDLVEESIINIVSLTIDLQISKTE